MATNRGSMEREMQAEESIQHLIELFGNVLDLEIIQSVALNCDYNMETTSQILLEMSSTIGAISKQTSPEWKKNNGKQMMSYAGVANNFPLRNGNNDEILFVSESPGRINSKQYTLPTQKKMTSPQRKSKKEQEFNRVILHVRQGSKVLILMRGLPGSGKSYLAKQIIDRGIGHPNYSDFILSTDDYFVDRRTGRYVYDRLKLTQAHEWNHQRAYKTMSEGISPVIIDNTNLQAWEMKPYVRMAVSFGYSVEIVEPFTHWAFNDKELARRNLHEVPKVKIKEMLERYERNITSHKLLNGLAYSPDCKPPQYRNYPPIDHLQGHYNGVSTTSFENNVSNKNTVKQNNQMEQAESLQVRDLMDFESDLFSKSTDYEEKTNSESDPLDNILMYNAGSNNSPDILKPDICNFYHKQTVVVNKNSEPEFKKARTFSEDFTDNADIIKSTQDASDFSSNETSEAASTSPKNAAEINKARDLYPKLNLSSWGLSDDAVSSWETWDIVKPLNSSKNSETMHYVSNLNTASSTSLYMSDSATNTSSADFAVLNKTNHVPENVKLLEATSRNINVGVIGPLANSSKKTLLDKSSMTNEDVLRAALSRERDANDEKHIAILISLFPGIPTDYLKDVYEKCGRDINWTGDILLDDKKEFLPFLQANDNDNNNNDDESGLATEEKIGNENVSDSKLNMKELSITPDILKKNLNDKKNKILLETTEEIKKHIEENVEINKNYYSEHILKLKNQRCGVGNNIDSQPSTSKASDFEAYPTSSGEVIAVNTDVDLDNFEPDIDFPEVEEEEMMELNLGDGVISQLETQFGFSQMLPQGFLPVIHVPVSLARQLYALYVESVLVQMENQNQVLDAIAKEDEEFARKLQMQEQRFANVDEGRKTPDLQEIMDEQAAANLYLKEVEEWKKLTPDNLAVRLTRQKLYNAFPSVNRDLLIEILHAHNNSYEQTVEVLMASTDHDKINDPDGNIMEPPISEIDIIEMKAAEEDTRQSAHAPDVPKTALEYREEASQHHQKHMALMQQAQQAYQRKQYGVAQFYSDLAKTKTQLYDQANNLAASAFLQENSKKLENFHTIDLHYLYVKEAIAALDMFIDSQIRWFEGTDKRQENLFVITGRGKRSDQGKSRIKPAVMARLRKRGIWYVEVNPGLLKIRIHPNSTLTSSLH